MVKYELGTVLIYSLSGCSTQWIESDAKRTSNELVLYVNMVNIVFQLDTSKNKNH